jgi:hypothetical protein
MTKLSKAIITKEDSLDYVEIWEEVFKSPCGHTVMRLDNYCSFCGTKLEWIGVEFEKESANKGGVV